MATMQSNNDASATDEHVSVEETTERNMKFEKCANELTDYVLQYVFGTRDPTHRASKNSLISIAIERKNRSTMIPMSDTRQQGMFGYFFSPEKRYGHRRWYSEQTKPTTGMYFVGYEMNDEGRVRQIASTPDNRDGVPLFKLLCGESRPRGWVGDWDPFRRQKNREIVPVLEQLNTHPLTKKYNIVFYTKWASRRNADGEYDSYLGAKGLFFSHVRKTEDATATATAPASSTATVVSPPQSGKTKATNPRNTSSQPRTKR